MSVCNNHSSGGNIASSRVRVIPGSSLSSLPTPSPPSYSPPKPTNLCKIAVVGDEFCGKSALVQKFIHRRYATSNGADCEENCDGDTNTNGAASATGNSIGTSLGASFGASYDGLESTLAEYYKKDITIWEDQIDNNQTNENGQRENETLEQKAVCIRVQLWDMNIHQQQNDTDIDSCTHSVHSECSALRNANVSRLLPLLKRVNGILIVCRCPLPPSSASQSSIASCASHASNASCSEWPALDLLEQQIQRWMIFIHDQEVNDEKQRPPTFALLSCADLAIVGYSPREWMRLSVRMQDICKKWGIESWRMGTCMDASSNTIDGNHPQQSTLLKRMIQQQKQILEDTEDAVEVAFIDLISVHLHQSRKLHKLS